MLNQKVGSEPAAAYLIEGVPRALSPKSQKLIRTAIEAIEAYWGEPGVAITTPAETTNYLKLKFAGLEHEVFGCLFLCNRHKVLGYTELFRGTIDGASIHPREVVKEALKYNACAMVLCHNHPSGDATPSHADKAITHRLKETLQLIDVRILDHIVIGRGEPVSMAKMGLI